MPDCNSLILSNIKKDKNYKIVNFLLKSKKFRHLLDLFILNQNVHYRLKSAMI
jgi:hypothetical protein